MLAFSDMGLSDKDIEVMSLHYYEGFSYSEIGSFLGITKQSIKDRIHRVRRIFSENNIPEPTRMSEPLKIKNRFNFDPMALESVESIREMVDSHSIGKGKQRNGHS